MNKIYILLILTFALIACSNKFKHKLGLVETIPDEYQVKNIKPLEVPPHYDIPQAQRRTDDNPTLTRNTISNAEADIIKAVDREL